MRKLLIVSLLVLFSSTCFAQYRGGRIYAPGRFYHAPVYRGYVGYRPYYRGVYPRYYAPGYIAGYAPYYDPYFSYYDPYPIYPVYVRPAPRIVVGPTVVIGGGGWRRFHR